MLDVRSSGVNNSVVWYEIFWLQWSLSWDVVCALWCGMYIVSV